MVKCTCGESLVVQNVCANKECGRISDITLKDAFQIKMRCKKCTLAMCGVPLLLCGVCTEKGLSVVSGIGDGMVNIYKGDSVVYSYRQYSQIKDGVLYKMCAQVW